MATSQHPRIVIFAPDAFAVCEYHRKFISLMYVLPALQDKK